MLRIVLGALATILGGAVVLQYFFFAKPRIVTEEYLQARTTAGIVGGVLLLVGVVALLSARKNPK